MTNKKYQEALNRKEKYIDVVKQYHKIVDETVELYSHAIDTISDNQVDLIRKAARNKVNVEKYRNDYAMAATEAGMAFDAPIIYIR